MRADLYLVEHGFAKSRTKAKEMIDEGNVYFDGKQVTKASLDISEAEVEIRGELLPYVSRGGLKLKGALDSFGIDVNNAVCLDIGASTGGFTDCLLQHGAKRVYAVDCGHGQLDKKLICDDRVISIEGFNARELSVDIIPEKIDACVMDVSFISQTLIHSVISPLLNCGAVFITLIKPQFEVGRGGIGKNGIVKDEKARELAVNKVIESAVACGFRLMNRMTSPICGGDGNIEYIGYFSYEGCSDTKQK